MKTFTTLINTIIISMAIFYVNPISAQNDASKGCTYGNCENGYGIYIYKDGTKYKGDFKESQAEGKGACYYQNGDHYIGEWSKHTFHGKGTLHFSDGTKMTGIWNYGDFQEERDLSVSSQEQQTGKVWAMIVGVATYENYKSLRFTDDDAYKMYSFLKSPEGGAVPEDHITLLIDDAATKETIKESLKTIMTKADTNDTVIFYFAGHGVKGAFLPSNYEKSKNNELPHNEILRFLNKGKAKNKILIADICNAGSMGEELYSMRGGIDNTIQEYHKALSKSSGGTALILASSANEQSIENRGIRQGVFSYYLIEGLKGRADENDNKLITISELFDFTKKHVQRYTNYIQNPIIFGNYDPNVPLGIVRN